MRSLLVLFVDRLVLPTVALWTGSHGKEELAVVTVLVGRANEPATTDLQVVLCTLICTGEIEIAVAGLFKRDILVLVLTLCGVYKRSPVSLQIHIH